MDAYLFHNLSRKEKFKYQLKTQPVFYRVIIFIILSFAIFRLVKGISDYVPFLNGVNMAFHEAGHIFTMTWAPFEIIAIAGSVFQLLVPLVFILIALKNHYYFDSCMLVVWLGTNLHYIGGYIIDSMKFEWASSQLFGPDGIHDWNFLLARWDLLYYSEKIGTTIINISFAIMFLALLCGLILLIMQLKVKVKEKS